MIAVYPGSFDPITSGHFDIIARAARLYDTLVVAVAQNADKDATFSMSERVKLVELAVADAGFKNVRVACFSDSLLVDYTESLGARVIVKGLRAVSDFEYEFSMALLNQRLKPGIETVFMMTTADYSFLSSSIVKQIARLRGNIGGLVPDAIRQSIESKFAGITS